MFKGGQLSVFIGPVVPQPAPAVLLEHLQQTTVTLADTGRSGFQLNFRVGRDRITGQEGFPPLLQRTLKIGTRVQLVGTLGGTNHVLMDGVITTHQLQPSTVPGETTLTVTGEDITVMLDLIEVKIPFISMPEFVQAGALLAALAPFGVIPKVIPSPGDIGRLPIEPAPMVDGTFLSALTSKASKWGYVFYWEPGPVRGTSIAYWGPPVRMGVPQRALSFGMGGESNVQSLSFSDGGMGVKLVGGLIKEANTQVYLPVVGLPFLGPPLAARPALVENLPMVGFAALDKDYGGNYFHALADATASQLRGTQGASSAQGQLDTATYGTVLKAHGLVDVRGVGWTHDGTWYVKNVTHTIGRGSWTQAFNLEREGTGALTDKVASPMTSRQYFGKYRGTVINNIDPMRMGRLQVSCPHVLGIAGITWAMPCVPFAGPLEGFYMMPLIGSNVWVEFEAGDPELPIWAGCFWTTQTIPVKAISPFVRTIKSTGCEVTLDDTPGAGGVTLQVLPPTVAVPTTIRLDATGILINVGAATVKLDPATVNVNNGALMVI